MKPKRRREVEKALRRHGCVKAAGLDTGPHTKWICPCGQHATAVPRHTEITAGVVRNIAQQMACLPKGWLA